MNRLLPVLLALAAPAAAWAQERPSDLPRLERPPAAEGFRLNARSPYLKGAALYGRELLTSRLEADVPFAQEIRSDGFNPVFTTRLELSEIEFDAPVLGIAADLDLFRFSANFFAGEWEGEGTLTVDDGIGPATTRPVSLQGDVRGFKAALEWPLLQFRSGGFGASLGPEFGVLWVHEDLDDVPESPLQFSDDFDQLVGSLGPKFRLGVDLGGFAILAEVLPAYLFDQLQGWSFEASLGVGLRF